MTPQRTIRSLGAVLVMAATSAPGAQVAARFENLQVLPSSIPGDSLLAIMGGFTRALGVRCTHCHVARNGVRPAADEFASDDREPKRVAREMLRMTRTINDEHLVRTGRPRQSLARVECATCHRGVARPQSLDVALLETYEQSGIDSTMARYRALRARYLGAGSYDFTDVPLVTLADALAARAARRDDAVRLMRLNLEDHPNSWFTYQQLGQLLATMGDTAAALAALDRGLELNPGRAFLQELRARLRPPRD